MTGGGEKQHSKFPHRACRIHSDEILTFRGHLYNRVADLQFIAK